MPDWLIWFLIGMGLIAIEALVAFTFYAGAIAIGAFPAAIVAALGASLEVQVAVFAVGAGLSVLFLRPLARRHLQTPERIRTGTDQLLGSRAVVTRDVDADGGEVKVVGGGVWTARSGEPDLRFTVGTTVLVAAVRGVALIVEPQPEPPPDDAGPR